MVLTDELKKILGAIYNDYTHPAGVSSVKYLHDAVRQQYPEVRATARDVREYLTYEPSYTLHKLTRKRFDRRKTVAARPRSIITADLADMASLSNHNNGVKYLLVCLDVFSRFMVVKTLKTKTMGEVSRCFKEIFNDGVFKGARRLFTDEGGEFKNKMIEKLLKENKMKSYITYSREIKSSIAERHVRTIKEKIYKYLTLKKTLQYVNVLQDLVTAYNNRKHRGLYYNTPYSVHYEFSADQIKKLYKQMYINPYKGRTIKKVNQNLAIGDSVRLASTARQSVFAKGYREVNTREIFIVRDIDKNNKIYGYYLKDLLNDNIDGIFYREELIPTKIPEKFDFEIIRSRRTKSGKKQYYVSWVGYGPKFNSYIDESDLIDR